MHSVLRVHSLNVILRGDKTLKEISVWSFQIENGIEIKLVNSGIIYVHLCKTPLLIYVSFIPHL